MLELEGNARRLSPPGVSVQRVRKQQKTNRLAFQQYHQQYQGMRKCMEGILTGLVAGDGVPGGSTLSTSVFLFLSRDVASLVQFGSKLRLR